MFLKFFRFWEGTIYAPPSVDEPVVLRVFLLLLGSCSTVAVTRWFCERAEMLLGACACDSNSLFPPSVEIMLRALRSSR